MEEKKTTIFLVRHGETKGNIEKKLQGSLNTPLTDKGIAQAKRLKERLANFEIDLAFTSPLTRAKKTCEYIVEPHNITITILGC